MGKIVFLFPGQGSQKVGMGSSLAAASPAAKELMGRADDALNFSLSNLCYSGAEEELALTQNTQPAILTVSAMALAAFAEKSDIKPDFIAGHSLGEFSAIYGGGGCGFEEAVTLVLKRGLYMSESSGGVMAAVLGLSATEIEQACKDASSGDDFIQAANYNGDGQTVIAGTPAGLDAAEPILKERGAKRIIRLNVSAAFHTPLMKSAAASLAKDLDITNFIDITSTLINNVDAAKVSSATDIRDGLKRQVTGAVRWTEIMNTLKAQSPSTVIEFGPSKTLIGMMKRVDRSITYLNVEDEESLNKTLEVLGC